jgi:phospholipid-binding lipoprotein MlaA
MKVLALMLVAACLWAGPARAEDDYLERWNRAMFDFNVAMSQGWASASKQVSGLVASASAGTAVPNLLSNLINEPLSVVAFGIAGDPENAWVATRRFVINTTLGAGGMRDVAAERGMPSTYIDMGLALCAHGVRPGAYVVLPFTGPRTVRDGVMDLLFANALIYSVVFATIGTGAPLTTIIVVEIFDTFANLAILRQIDTIPLTGPDVTYERVKTAYLESRSQRCDAIAAQYGATPPSSGQ